MSNLRGFVPAGQESRFYFRGFIYGEPKTGKSVFCGSWPAPLFMHPVIEGGYDTFRLPNKQNMFDHVELGKEHHLWVDEAVGKESHSKVSDEIRSWLRSLALDLHNGRCSYQTIVLGGFNVVQEMVIAEATKYNPGTSKTQQMWGYVAKWATELLQLVNAFPAHVIIECGTNIKEKDRKSGTASAWSPAISGKAYNSVLAGVNAIMFQYKEAGERYMTSMAASPNYVAGTRLPAISSSVPIQNCCYDWFAYRLGLPPIYEADPNHPRVIYNGRPEWPWFQSWDPQFL